VGVEIVVPPFTALFSDSAMEVVSDLRPIFGSILGHKLDDFLIFLFGPRSFDQRRVKHSFPSILALKFITIWHLHGNCIPVLVDHLRCGFDQALYHSGKCLVFLFGPSAFGVIFLDSFRNCRCSTKTSFVHFDNGNAVGGIVGGRMVIAIEVVAVFVIVGIVVDGVRTMVVVVAVRDMFSG